METPPPGSVSACSVTSIAVLSGTWTRKKSTSPAGEIAPSWTPAAMSVAVAGVLLGSVSATVGVMVGRAVGAVVGVVVGATVAAVEGATVGAVVGASVVWAVRCGVLVRSAAAFRSMPPRKARSARTRTRIAGTIARRQGNPPRASGGAITAVAAPPATVGATRIGSAGGGGSTRATPLTRPDGDNSGDAAPSWLGSGTGLFTWAISAERGLSDGNGWRPTSIWYAMIPSAYWSAAGPALSAPPASSGAM